MCSFAILFTCLGFILMITAQGDDASLFSTTDTPDLDPLWDTDSDLSLASPGDVADNCISFDSGFAGRVRARESCGDLSPPVDDGDLFGSEPPLNIEGYDDGSYDTALSDSSFTWNSSSDFLFSIGANCQPDSSQSPSKLRARGEVCKDPPTIVHPQSGWNGDLDWGMSNGETPDYERLQQLPFLPGENNDEICPLDVIGRRYAVCGPMNEAQDVLGFGTTLRDVHLLFVGTDECEYPRIIYCCEIYYELTRGTRVRGFAHYCVSISSYRDRGYFW